MKLLLFCFLLSSTVISNVFSAPSFLESLCLKCNTTIEMILPQKIDTFYTLSDLAIKNFCSKMSDNLEDTCYSVINVPLRIQYNIIWTLVSPFRELIYTLLIDETPISQFDCSTDGLSLMVSVLPNTISVPLEFSSTSHVPNPTPFSQLPMPSASTLRLFFNVIN
uniref:Saposin B-type domain-containing protein n=1 Tax=Caenorhabditis tropicalis TaxID=1561998 RepID=A0A1I7UYI8_9PELO